MSEIQNYSFDESELANIIIDLSKTIHEIQVLTPIKDDWDGLKGKMEKYLRKLREFANNHKANQLSIQATIGFPPKIDLGLTFTRNE
jgi:hypothetical protein